MGGAGSGLLLGWPALWQSGESLVRSNLDKIAESINRELGKSVEEGGRLAARRPSKVDTGELRYRTQLFLDRPPENWSLKDAASVLATFMTQTSGNIVGGPPVLGKGVHTLWLTQPVHRAVRRARELLAQGQESMWVHPFTFSFDDDLLRRADNTDAYAFAVWPFDKPPYYWNREAIAASTFLRRVGHGEEKVAPVAILGPPWPPAVFLFPRTLNDGSPLIGSLATIVELHTQMNGRQILSRFELSRFGLRSVHQLTGVETSPIR
jgi:hypothetical protein